MSLRRPRKPYDKYGLYERSVQRPQFDIDFVTRVYRAEHGRVPLALREDFCGTAFISSEWVRSHPRRTALGLDLDPAPLAWGRKWNIEPLGDDARREELVDYFRKARRAIKRGGAFMLDGYSGPDSLSPGNEVRNYAKFVYTWDQRMMDAITGRGIRYIHFKMKGQRKKMERAFTYDWRLWTITELMDALAEAGFARVDVYDEKKNGYRRVSRADWKDAFIPILVAWV